MAKNRDDATPADGLQVGIAHIAPIWLERAATLNTIQDYVSMAVEWQNFDPSGRYAHPDVIRLIVNRRRQSPASFLHEAIRKGRPLDKLPIQPCNAFVNGRGV